MNINKVCRHCLQTKHINKFFKNHKMSDGHLNHCKVCTSAKAKGVSTYIYGKRSRDKQNFDGLRERVIIRDGGKCVKCGISRDDHIAKYRRDITVDHIDGRGCNTPQSEKNNDLNNLQTLCCSCHGKKDINRSPNTKPRPVWQLNLSGEKIKLHPSIIDAARATGLPDSASTIIRVLSGEYQTSGGYKWEYAQEDTQ